MPDLTAKQRRFVDEYLVDLNATQAAIRAGYSEKTAYSIGQENLSKPEIADAIAEAFKARSERTKIDADWVLNRLVAEAEADVADIFEEDGSLKKVKDWPAIWRKGLVVGVEANEITAGENVIGTVRKVRLSERIKRIELIGKHVGVQAFREKVSLENPDGTPAAPDGRELARMIAFALASGKQAADKASK